MPKELLRQLANVIKKGNHRAEALLEVFKKLLKEKPEKKEELEYAITILEEIIKLKNQKNYRKRYNRLKRRLLFSLLGIMTLIIISSICAEISNIINGIKYLSVSDDGVRLYDDQGNLLVIFNDEAKNYTARFEGSMMNNDNINDTSRFVERNLNNGSLASAAFTVRNDIPYSASFGLTSSTFSYGGIGSNVAGISSLAPGNMVFINRYNYPIIWYINKQNDSSLDNITEIMRLDENGLYINGTIDSEDGLGVILINAINISTDNINADVIQAPIGKFENITGDKLNIDLIYVTDITVDNLEVTDLITGSNAGTDLCVGADDVLCICGSCA